MSRCKKIILIIAAGLIAASLLTVAIIPVIKDTVYSNMSRADPPAQVVDFGEKADDAIRVMSFNIRYGSLGIINASDRHPLIEETIRNGHPDSVGLQEATPSWMKYLTNALGDEYSYVGVGRDDGDNSGEYSAIFYLKDKYNAVDSGTFWLSETPDEPSKGWDADCKRICTWAVLENKETGEQYLHLNAHFDHVGEEARRHSVEMILEKAIEYEDLPVVFTADMNIKEGSENYVSILEDGILTDTKYSAEDTMDYLTFHNTTPSENDGRILDYVLINDKFDAEVYKVVTAGIGGKFVSDHYPVYADIVVK